MGAGNFGVTFLQDQTPSEVINKIKEWGHIVVTPQEMNPSLYDDASMLASARYTGVVLAKSLEEGVVTVSGQGLQLYLGDDRGKGMVIAENQNLGKKRTYTNLPLSSVLFQSSQPYGIMRNEAGNLQAITQGTIYDGSDTYTGTHFVETALHALKFICEDLGYEFRVNSDATIDAGPAANLFTGVNTDPSTVVVKTGYGDDPTYTGLSPTGARTEFDARDYVTKVDFIAEVGAFNEPTDFEGEASLSSGDIPYYDIHGNKLSRTGLVSVPDMDSDRLDSQAQVMLNELSRVKKVLNLDLEEYEVTGDLKTGDYIFAFDPVLGFNDTETQASAESRNLYEISFRGQQINPIKVRVVGLSYPIKSGMGVYFRSFDGSNVTYTDLTPYVSFEEGDTQVELGDVLRDISDDMRFNEYSIASRTASAKSIPDLPSTPTLQSGTYLDATGESKGFVRIVFSKPSNIDGSNITDGSHYRVRYRVSDGLSTSGGASANEYSYKDFPYTVASTETLMITDLTVGKAYRIGVSTVDTSGFRRKTDYTASGEDVYTDTPSINPNYTTNAIIEIDRDGQAPSKPKQAQAISASALRVQVTHYLGKDGVDGLGNPFGDFTLEGDVDHLDVHAVTQNGNTANFTVSTSTKRGELRVTSGNILQQIPLVGTMELEDSQDYYFRFVAVDKSGNESPASDGQTAVANLIAEANIADATITTAKIGLAQITNALIADATITSAKISDLTADKITAGTIDASVITVTNLNASNITAGTLDANTVTISNLTVDVADVNNLNFSSLGATSQDIINTIATDAILTTISNGAIPQAKLGTLTVDVANVNNLNFSSLGATSQDIINTLATDAILSTISNGSIAEAKLGSISANKISAGTLTGFNISGGTINIGNALSADNSGVTMTQSVTIAPTSGSIGNGNVTVSGSSGSFSSVGVTNNISASNGIFSGYVTGDEFRGNNSTVDIHRNGTSNGIRISGSGSGAYLYGYSSSGAAQIIYSPFSGVSDERLKENVVDLTLGLDEVNALRPVTFDWKASDIDDIPNNRYGFIAQEVESVVPTMISTQPATRIDFDEEGEEISVPNVITLDDGTEVSEWKSIDEKPLMYMLVKSIQELSTKVDDLTARIEVLEG